MVAGSQRNIGLAGGCNRRRGCWCSRVGEDTKHPSFNLFTPGSIRIERVSHPLIDTCGYGYKFNYPLLFSFWFWQDSHGRQVTVVWPLQCAGLQSSSERREQDNPPPWQVPQSTPLEDFLSICTNNFHSFERKFLSPLINYKKGTGPRLRLLK